MAKNTTQTASATGKKGFIVYTDNRPIIEKLTDDDAGKLFKALIQYEDELSIPDLPYAPSVAFEMFRRYLDINRANHKKVSEIRSEIGKKGYEAKSSKRQANESKAKQKQAIAYEKEKDNDIEYKEEEYTADFRRFWESYPKKMSQELAWQAFKSVTVPVDVLIKSVKEHAASEDWKKEKGKFIPFPHNFLASKRWTDELPAVEKVKISDWNQDCCNHKGQPVNKDNLTLAEFCKLHKLGSHAE